MIITFLPSSFLFSSLVIVVTLSSIIISSMPIVLAQAQQQRQQTDNSIDNDIQEEDITAVDKDVTCQELDRFYRIIDKLADWQDPKITDQEYNLAQDVELDLVEDLGCDDYFIGEEYELWSYDN